MTSPAQARIDASMARLDSILDQRLRREEQELAADNADREAARRQRQRDNAEQRRQIQVTYADAFASFGTDVPAPADDEGPSAYRRRLYNRLARRLPSGHELADVRADDLGSQAVVFDNFETALLKAAEQEGLKPSFSNLPSDGTLVARQRVGDMGEKSTEYYGTRSFIADLSRPAQRVVRIVDPNKGIVLQGPDFPRR
jgi:hypothetical protein